MSHQGPSQVSRAVVRFIPDASTRVAALEAGEVQASELVPALDMRRFDATGEFATMVGNASGLPFGALFNTSMGVFADKAVRQAFMHAVDRPTLAANLFFGFADPAYGPISSSTPSYWITGAVITETVFARPGLGQLLLPSVLNKDIPLVQALVVYATGAYILLNLIVDLLYGVIDPRIKLEQAS